MIVNRPEWLGSAATQLAGNGVGCLIQVAPSSRLVSKIPHGQLVLPGAADGVGERDHAVRSRGDVIAGLLSSDLRA